MTERIKSVLQANGLPAVHWCEPPKDVALRGRLSDITDGFERLSVRELRERDYQLQGLFQDASVARDAEAIDAIRRAGRPLIERLRALESDAVFARACPIEWLHKASEAEAIASVNAEKLRKLLGDPLVLNRSLLLCGPTKAGKSTALAIMLRRTLAAGYLRARAKQGLSGPPIDWAYARGLAQAARQHPLGQGECQAVVNATTAGILVLDDLGLERDPAEIVDVVHDRYEAGRVTWTTTGLDKAQLIERYGEAFYRRLVEGRSQAGLVVNCFGVTP